MKKSRGQILVLLFTLLYLFLFGLYYILSKNFEFMIYLVVMVFLLFLMIFLHSRFSFPTGVLFGASIWGLMHVAGGSIRINGNVLYALKLIPIYVTENFYVLKFDQFVHFYCYIFATLIAFYILKHYIDKKASWLALSIFLIFIGMGIGALNEIIEFSAVLIIKNTGVGDYFNNMWDLVFNTLGAIVAVLYLTIKKKYS